MLETLRVIDYDEVSGKYNFVAVVDEYSNALYRFCRSITYSKEDAEDLFQETFLKAFEQPQKLNALNNPQAFLFSTSLYIWKSWKRKYARRKRLAPMESLYETISSNDDVEKSFLLQEENQIVKNLVKDLPEKFKIPTILYYTIDMSISDIASILKLPNGTVKSRLYKARKLVEKGLNDIYYER